MDSLTQIVLGSTVAALAVRPEHRRKALAVGAVLGTLPDLDVLPMMLWPSDPVTQMVTHRGASHSLLVLPFVAGALWLLLRRLWAPVRESPGRWFWAIALVLLTHPLLDAFTVYGTQLLWPFRPPPVMWSNLWIIDPAYTLPLLFGVVAAAILGAKRAGWVCLVVGALLSTLYLAWSLTAKYLVERAADAALAPLQLQNAPRFSVPTALNSVLWQITVMTPDGYAIGYRSLVADSNPIQFQHYSSDVGALQEAAATVPAVQQLLWFNRGFMRASVDEQGRLILSDLRMGSEPGYAFQFAVAQRVDGHWAPIEPERVPTSMNIMETLPVLWERLLHEPAAP